MDSHPYHSVTCERCHKTLQYPDDSVQVYIRTGQCAACSKVAPDAHAERWEDPR